MAFISFEFLTLALLTLVAYYLSLFRRFQVGTLVTASIVFYAWDQWRLLPLLILAATVTYISMLGAIRKSRHSLRWGIAINLGLLCFFKYKFLLVSQPSQFESGSDTLDFLIRLPLPIGISFFVFHNISLIVDLRYRIWR